MRLKYTLAAAAAFGVLVYLIEYTSPGAVTTPLLLLCMFGGSYFAVRAMNWED